MLSTCELCPHRSHTLNPRVLVSFPQVARGGPAERAGVKVGSRLVDVAGVEVYRRTPGFLYNLVLGNPKHSTTNPKPEHRNLFSKTTHPEPQCFKTSTPNPKHAGKEGTRVELGMQAPGSSASSPATRLHVSRAFFDQTSLSTPTPSPPPPTPPPTAAALPSLGSTAHAASPPPPPASLGMAGFGGEVRVGVGMTLKKDQDGLYAVREVRLPIARVCGGVSRGRHIA